MKPFRIAFFFFFILAAAAVTAFAGAKPAALQGISASVHVQTASCEEPTVAAVLSVTDVPLKQSFPCTIEWYRDGVPISQKTSFLLYQGAFSVCRFTVCFSEDMPKTTELTAVIKYGAQTQTFSAKMQPKNRTAAFYDRLKTLKKPYRIDISRLQNVVLVWAQDEAGQYTLLQNVFLCSTGMATPRGTFSTGERIRWHALFGSEETDYKYVYGQYITRITESILFHSVPYYTKNPGDLETLQYNQLGTRVSQGCVRLTVEAAKWIYDNVPAGTEVTFSDKLELPVRMPAAPKITLTNSRRGWDPTDPDQNNPWHKNIAAND